MDKMDSSGQSWVPVAVPWECMSNDRNHADLHSD